MESIYGAGFWSVCHGHEWLTRLCALGVGRLVVGTLICDIAALVASRHARNRNTALSNTRFIYYSEFRAIVHIGLKVFKTFFPRFSAGSESINCSRTSKTAYIISRLVQ